MKIGYNAQILSSADAGVATYARSLLKALAGLSAPDEIYVFGLKKFLKDISSPLRLIPTSIDMNGWLRVAWEQLALPLKCRHYNVDVMFYPDHTAPLLMKPCPVVITVHDLAFLTYPQTFPPLRRMYKSFAVKQSLHRADAVVVVSEATREECLRFFTVDEPKLHVIHNGLDSAFSVVNDERKLNHVRKKYTLPDRFILFVGTLEPRKNVLGLVRAFSQLRNRENPKLVIAGARGWMYDNIFREVKQINLEEQVLFLGYVPQNDLVCIYNLAELFVYPSLYEGFGFPPLEAMACGVPVITSDRSSLLEIVGDAALLINPQDQESMLRAIQSLLQDRAKQNDLKQRGFERVKNYAWEKTAKSVLELCRNLVNNRK